jgi:hypothetical protein
MHVSLQSCALNLTLISSNVPEDGDQSPEGSKIPPNATLRFEIELLSWEDRKDVSLKADKS